MEKRKRGFARTNYFLKKAVVWAAILAVFYILTSAEPKIETTELSKKLPEDEHSIQPIVVEKLVNVTKYKAEKKPYGLPKCMQVVYNFTKTYSYSENFAEGKKIATCTFFVKNEEDIPGNFSFYPLVIKAGDVNDGAEILKSIEAFGIERFEWNFTIHITEPLTCQLKSGDYPHRIRCFYPDPITYEIVETPYVVEELKNITEYVIRESVEWDVKEKIYINRVFGYKQFFYLGY